MYFISHLIFFHLFYFFIVIVIWTLVWLEIPLVANMINNAKKQPDTENQWKFKVLVSDVFTYDYVWALLATFLFPFFLLPKLWIMYTALVFGFLNILVSLWFLKLKFVKKELVDDKFFDMAHVIFFFAIILYLLMWVYIKTNYESVWDQFFYKHPIVYKNQSIYQDIVITKKWDDIRMYLDWHLQFVSLDEIRYHDWLWYLWDYYFKTNKSKEERNILVMGGGDWLLVRNILETFSGHNNFNIDLVDIDSAITILATENDLMRTMNNWSMLNENVNVINEDAFKFVLDKSNSDANKYDIIVADFPDPRNAWLSKLYSKEFYILVSNILDHNGVFVTQSWNAFFSKESFWVINKTIESVFWSKVIPYHVYIPSFWDWWFNAYVWFDYNEDIYDYSLINFEFDNDYHVDIENYKVNRIEDPVIIKYYLEWWKRFNL